MGCERPSQRAETEEENENHYHREHGPRGLRGRSDLILHLSSELDLNEILSQTGKWTRSELAKGRNGPDSLKFLPKASMCNTLALSFLSGNRANLHRRLICGHEVLTPQVRLETPRLVLRPATHEDAELLLKLFSIPEVWRYLPPGPPYTLERAHAGIERRMKLEGTRGFSPMLVFRKDTGEFIGNAGLQPVPETSEVEIAYHYLPSVWGKGYGTEAAIAILADGLGRLGLSNIIAICIAENVGSWRIMEKAGMRYVGRASYYGLEGLKKYVAERDAWSSPKRPS